MKKITIVWAAPNTYYASDPESENLLRHINNGISFVILDKNNLIDNLKFNDLQALAEAHSWNIVIGEGAICLD